MIELIKNLINSILALFSNSKKEATETDNTKKQPKPIIKNTTDTVKTTDTSKEDITITPKPDDNMNEQKKKLYALIVGINDYQFVGKLGGCVNDANRVHKYFEKVTDNSPFEYHPLVLTDEKATKKGIENAFLTHLTQAGENDVVVYYFSGHGAEEKADTVWQKTESHRALQTQVCYDSRDDNGTPDLADKELRYLIHRVSLNNPHIVVISDSCHSGDNSRTDLIKRRLNYEFDADKNIVTSRLSGYSPMRTWDKFCFSDKISKEMAAGATNLSDVLPEGKHIQIGACKDRELAYEMRGSGIFTSMFLNVLERSSGNISYTDLRQRIRHSITGKFNQVPQIDIRNGNTVELHETFLGGASVKDSMYYNVQKNLRNSIGWTLDIGAIHGVPSNADAGLVIEIRDTNNKSTILTTATVKKVEPGMTRLEVADESKLDAKGQYFATIPKLFTEPLRMYLHGDKNGLDILKDRISRDTYFKYSNLEVTKDLVLADYLIYAKKGAEKDYYFIGNTINDLSKIDDYYTTTLKGDDTPLDFPYWKWLTEQQKGFYPGAATEIIKFMKIAANWHFLKKLTNENTQLKEHGIELMINQVPNRKLENSLPIMFEDNVAEVQFDGGSKPPSTFFTISIKNNSNRKYRIAAPALFAAFEAYTATIPNGVTEIAAGETKKMFDGGLAPIYLFEPSSDEDESYNTWVKDFNWQYKSWWIKLIISTDDFNIDNFASKALPYPKVPRPGKEIKQKGFGEIGLPSKPVITTDWTTELFEIKMMNPFYVAPPEDFV